MARSVKCGVLWLCAFGIAVSLRADTDIVIFDPSRGLVEFTAVVNGATRGRFGVDTGADRFYVDRDFARRAGLSITPVNGARVRGVDGESTIESAFLRSFAVGEEALYNVPVDVIDINRLSENGRIDGLVGHIALSRFYVTVNYPARTFVLHAQEPEFLKGPESDYAVAPFRLEGHLVVVDVALEGPEHLRLFLDFCANVSTLSPAAAIRVGLTASTDGWVAPTWAQVGDVRVNAPRFVVRDLKHILPPRSQGSVDGILGYTFLRDLCLTIDYHRDKIYFHRSSSTDGGD